MQVNESQLKAINHTTGSMLVLAGPGSGKTTVITMRVKRMLESGIPAESILVVTFTKAAALEMKERFLKAIGEARTAVTFGTFHSIFYGILRMAFALSSENIIGEDEKSALIKEILSGISKETLEAQDVRLSVAQEISLVKTNKIPIDTYYSGTLSTELFRRIYNEYTRWMNENRKLDFDDLLIKTYELLKSRPEYLAKWQKRFRYILIDEFQDINPVQYDIIRMLAKPEDNLFIVGDDDQSIYRFRSASPELMLSFPKLYPEAKRVLLDKNYRCSAEILDAALTVISENKKRFKKDLVSVRGNKTPVKFHVYKDLKEEAADIAARIKRLAELGIPAEKIAVLIRTNAQAGLFTEQFLLAKLPFYCPEHFMCVYDHWTAGDIFAYLRAARGETTRENFVRIINRPTRYITREAFTGKNVSFEDLYIYYEDRHWMWERIERLEEDLKAIKNLSPGAAVHYIRKAVGYDGYIKEYASQRGIKPDDLLLVLDELQESAGGFKSITDWFSHIEEYKEGLKEKAWQGTGEKNGVRILTIHAAKGMEYQAVFVPNVNEGNIPYRKAVLSDDIEEERRLLYVAMTRAKNFLYLSAVKESRGKKTGVSRFISKLQL